jgi:PTS system mannose-specific IIA component
MVGVTLITHGKLADILINTAEEITGPLENISSVIVDKDDDPKKVRGTVSKAIKEVDQGDGVIILTDMFGGTPSNIGLSFLSSGKVELITGVNLPILLKLASRKADESLSELAGMLKKKGQDSIVLASEMLKEKS